MRWTKGEYIQYFHLPSDWQIMALHTQELDNHISVLEPVVHAALAVDQPDNHASRDQHTYEVDYLEEAAAEVSEFLKDNKNFKVEVSTILK